MTPALARVLFDPVSFLPEWGAVALAGAERSAVNAKLIRQHALPAWTAPEPGAAEVVHHFVDAWPVLDIAAGLLGCAALRRRLTVGPMWTSMSPRVHEFILAGYMAEGDAFDGARVDIAQASSYGARMFLGLTTPLPGWLSARLALRYGLTAPDALPVNRTCLWNAFKHAKRYPDISDFIRH